MSKKELEKLRAQKGGKEMRYAHALAFFGTAASIAAAASDVVDKAYAGALGNLGMFLILIRFYLNVPRVIAKAVRPDERWYRMETDHLYDVFPWAEQVGRVGWVCLFVGVVLQLGLGIP